MNTQCLIQHVCRAAAASVLSVITQDAFRHSIKCFIVFLTMENGVYYSGLLLHLGIDNFRSVGVPRCKRAKSQFLCFFWYDIKAVEAAAASKVNMQRFEQCKQ